MKDDTNQPRVRSGSAMAHDQREPQRPPAQAADSRPDRPSVTRLSSRTILRKLRVMTGVGLAQPTSMPPNMLNPMSGPKIMIAGNSRVPMGSTWYMGLSVTRPSRRAVWSPSSEAVQACAHSCTLSEKMSRTNSKTAMRKAADCKRTLPWTGKLRLAWAPARHQALSAGKLPTTSPGRTLVLPARSRGCRCARHLRWSWASVSPGRDRRANRYGEKIRENEPITAPFPMVMPPRSFNSTRWRMVTPSPIERL